METEGLTGALKTVGKGLVKVGAVALTATAALAAMAVTSANGFRELNALATVAGVTAQEFGALTFAANQFNISGEKLSDISKDVNEKLGEFVQTGAGGFLDFFEQVGD